MKLSVVIVNWNTKDLLKQCLESIYKETNNIDFEVFVIDNDSNDKSAEMAEELIESNFFQNLYLIKNKENAGFAKANNQAIKKCKGEFILLLNPDTIILDNALEKCVSYIEQKPKIGILGCQLLNPNKTIQPSCRKFPNLLSQIIILLKIHNIFPNLSPMRKYLMSDFDHKSEKEVDQVMGAFFLVKRSVFDKIGLLDEDFWIWFEEVDFCKRSKNTGFITYFYPRTHIIHYKAASFNQVLGIKKQIRLNNSMLLYFKKHQSLFAYLVILCLYPVSMVLAGIVDLVQKIKPINKKKDL
jgi:GT2 family glycosyltransferase